MSYLGFFEIYALISEDGGSDIEEDVNMYETIAEATNYNASYNLDYTGLYDARNPHIAPLDLFIYLFGDLVETGMV